MIMWVRVVVERAFRRPFLGPGLEGRELLERRQVVAAAGDYHLLGRRGLREIGEQALGRRLVLAEAPGAPEERQERPEAALGAGREAKRPALLIELRRIALGHR